MQLIRMKPLALSFIPFIVLHLSHDGFLIFDLSLTQLISFTTHYHEATITY